MNRVKKKMTAGVVLTGMALGMGASSASAQSAPTPSAPTHVIFSDEEAGSMTNYGDGYIQGDGHSGDLTEGEGTVPVPSFGVLGGLWSGTMKLGDALIEITIQTLKDVAKAAAIDAWKNIKPMTPVPPPDGPVDAGVPGGVPPQSNNTYAPDKSKETGDAPEKEEGTGTKPASDNPKNGSTDSDSSQTPAPAPDPDSSKSDKDGCAPNCPPPQNLPNPDSDGGPSGPAVHVPLDRVTQPTIDGGGPTGPASRYGTGIASQPTIDGGGPTGPASLTIG